MSTNLKERKASSLFREAFDYFSLSQTENEYRINKISGYIAVCTFTVMLIMYILNVTGIFILDSQKMLYTTLGLIIPCFPSFYIATIKQVHKPWVKYMIVISEAIIVLFVFSVLSMHVVLLFALPVIKSCLYFDRKLCHLATISTSVVMLLSHIFSVSFSIVFDDPLIPTVYQSLVFGFIPRFFEFLLIAIVANVLTNNSSQMLKNGYEYVSKTNELMNEQRETHFEIVKNLATITANKSHETGMHIERVFDYMVIMAKKAGCDEEEAINIGYSAMLHDIGKLIIDERILSKPSKLSDEEFLEVKKHAEYGKNLLSNSSNKVLEMAATIADEHHERWDGNGYHHQKGDEINPFSCLMSVIDVFDALTSIRCYKPAWTFEDALKEIEDKKGTQFSPEAVDLFLSCKDEIRAIYDQKKDEELK